jgi:hypothetical protein
LLQIDQLAVGGREAAIVARFGRQQDQPGFQSVEVYGNCGDSGFGWRRDGGRLGFA